MISSHQWNGAQGVRSLLPDKVGESGYAFSTFPNPNLQMDAKDITVRRDGSTTKLQEPGLLNNHLEESLPLIEKFTVDCYMSKK